ncbi:MAG: glycosyltransferase family 4 protein, partial [bacterium]
MGNLVEKCPPAAFVSTYPPRQCGIATFTCNLVKSLSTLSQHSKGLDNQNHLQVVALSKNPESYKFPADVHFLIRDQYQSDYRQAADFINLSAVDVVSLQHEYGIFGGPDGSHIITLLNNLKKPLVTTLHTVLMEPSANQKKTLEAIAKRSTYVVVLASKAMGILKEVYRVPEEKIVMIPHGTPDIAFLDSSFYKDQFQAEGKRIILTFGLLSPNKGIEYVIEAMARVVKRHPDTLFIILGVTHPEVRQLHGERYRISLENKVKELGLDQHVMFHNHFVSSEKLIQFLVAADIYVTPYLSREQIVSGTLAYAVSCGKAVISTPYWFAEELLNENRGILVPFRDSNAIAKKICDLLANEKKRNKLRKNAYQFGRQMRWSEVAKSYRKVFHKAMTRYRRETIVSGEQQTAPSSPTLPAIKLNHLYTLTDDTGILQHAIYSTPNREHGYCTDDNARALVVATAHYNLFHEEPILAPMQKYLAFLYHAFNTRKNRMRNFMSYDRRWLEDIGSEDCHGRTLYALGYAVSFAPNEHILGLANALFRHVVAGAAALSSPRTSAFSILGCLHYLQRFGGDTEGKTIA